MKKTLINQWFNFATLHSLFKIWKFTKCKGTFKRMLANFYKISPLYCCVTAGGGVVPRGGVGGGRGAPRGGGSGGGAPESPFWLPGEYFRLTIGWLLTVEPFSWIPLLWWTGPRGSGGGSRCCEERGGSAGGAPPLTESGAAPMPCRRLSRAMSMRPPLWMIALLQESCWWKQIKTLSEKTTKLK